ncbi:nucleotide sugar dehydrogenase [Mucilaginibacter sp. BT774]|uniref:nucleotide sugar dehydrogenase n=1 Tax=Mucilaginibacter sp. BT774 TaxID=3062276 RepID=UPI0026767410|nr:nucleotide sugar dehydrogenase [Mucilaginibacter sp. BT774]MDO3625921.1 nucleotide sugar dehydrogenase [Mucilaginibacter sp. BT774]
MSEIQSPSLFKPSEKVRIGIIGLGYVGLPLAAEFATKYTVIGFDINKKRIEELASGHDHTLEVSEEQLLKVVITRDQLNSHATGLFCTNDQECLNDCTVFIITVPTPTDRHNRPDLTPLYKASQTVGNALRKNDVVIYESTVYPGVTEDECVPVLEQMSGLKYNQDFFAGYSPERINPGDKEHTVAKILKVTSGSTTEVAEFVDQLYGSIIIAGTYKAASIKVAEAAKVIENTQRDINIAFVNELSKIFNRLGINTNDVLEAAGTKWNFLKFKPGLVGGHCIGVDPYYLAQKAQELGYHPEMILAGRRLNDGMGEYVADEVIKLMVRKGIQVIHSKVLLLGFTFKENCPDVRNTKVIDIERRLKEYKTDVHILDPWADPAEVNREYGVTCSNDTAIGAKYDAVILAVAHREFKDLDISGFLKDTAVVYDVKGVLSRDLVDACL